MTDRLADLQYGEPERDVEIGEDQAPPPQSDMLKKFERETTAITGALDKIEQSVNYINENADTEEHSSVKAQNILSQCKEKCDAIRKRLARMAEENKKMKEELVSGTDKYSNVELQIRISKSKELAERFRDITGLLENAEDDEKQRSVAAIYDEVRELNPDATEDEIREAVETNNFSMLLDPYQASAQRTELEERVGELQDRNNALKALETDVLQLHQMFMDMAILIENQGDLLNQIEYNVATTKKDAETAVNEVETARKYQLSARKKKIIIFVIIAIIIAVVVIAVVLAVR